MTRVIDLTYRQYIASDEWKAKRAERLELDGRTCTQCDATTYLEVHHLTYERLGNELMRDLSTLCQTCHARLHGSGPRVLPVSGTLTPRQRAEDDRTLREHRFLAAAGKLHEATEEFFYAVGAMASRRHDERMQQLRWLAEDIFQDVQEQVEAEAMRREAYKRRRKDAA